MSVFIYNLLFLNGYIQLLYSLLAGNGEAAEEDSAERNGEEDGVTGEMREESDERALPEGVRPGVSFWIVHSSGFSMAASFDAKVKKMFVEKGFTFCNCAVSHITEIIVLLNGNCDIFIIGVGK